MSKSHTELIGTLGHASVLFAMALARGGCFHLHLPARYEKYELPHQASRSHDAYKIRSVCILADAYYPRCGDSLGCKRAAEKRRYGATHLLKDTSVGAINVTKN